jgi:DNA-directed RNA polymerase I, II, and III subunit RPABC2
MAPKKITIPNPKQDADVKADVKADIKVDSSEIDDTSKLVKKPISIIKKKQITPTSISEKKEEEPKLDTVKPKIVKKVQVQASEKEPVKEQVKEQLIKDDVDEQDDKDDKEILLDASKLLKTKKHTSKKSDGNTSNEQINDEDVDFRTVLLNYDFSKNKTPAKITKYEKALIIGKRAKQIEEGANPNVKVLPGQSAIEIAEEELRQRKIPLIIKRPLGNTFEYWRPRDMEVLMD